LASLSQGKTRDSLRQVAQDVLNGNFFVLGSSPISLKTISFTGFAIRMLKAFSAVRGSAFSLIFLITIWLGLTKTFSRASISSLSIPRIAMISANTTLDWLCERMVVDLLPRQGFKAVLDSSCGSGSFLRACIAHYIEHNPSMEERERLSKIIAKVKGIDIHPVAVTIARATYVLALGPLIRRAPKPIQIPLYLADSLFLPREVEFNLIEQLSGIEITYGGRKDQRRFVVPDMLILSPICLTMPSRLAPRSPKSMRSQAKICGLQCPRTWRTLFRTY
jgi:hypothetical protein